MLNVVTFFRMLSIQKLIILIRIACLTIDIAVRAYFRKLINNKCQNEFSARHCIDLKMPKLEVIYQKYYQPIKKVTTLYVTWYYTNNYLLYILRTLIDCTFFDRRQSQKVVWWELICRDATVFYIT
jgi:hypothetical protein